MALSTDQRRTLESRLSNTLKQVDSLPENTGIAIKRIINTANVSPAELSIRIGADDKPSETPLETFKRHVEEINKASEWRMAMLELRAEFNIRGQGIFDTFDPDTVVKIINEQMPLLEERARKLKVVADQLERLGKECPWVDFYTMVKRKVNVSGRWRRQIQAIVGTSSAEFIRAEEAGRVPWDWLHDVMAMPDHDPENTVRSNYNAVRQPIEDALRGAGWTSEQIARHLTKFLSEFNGDKVTVADVRHDPSKVVKE